MASNPYFSPLHTQRFSFIGSPQQRDGTYQKDQRFLNMYPELIKSQMTDGKKYYLKKRPGISHAAPLGSGAGRGCYFWNGLWYVVVGNELYRSVANGSFTFVPLIPLATSTGSVGFAEFKDDSQDLLFFCDGQNGYTIGPGTGGGFVPVSSAAFPVPHIPAPIFLDGYIFLAAAGGQTIWNSNLNDPTTWPADGFIDAEMYPDNLVTLAKQQNYLVAVGGASIEFFYDNANATGSPLQRNAPAVAQIGCPAGDTVNQTEDQLIFVGNTQAGGRTVWVIKGFQPTEIATEPVREALDNEGINIGISSAMTVQCAGHKWYIINLYGAGRTFVYDFEEQMWHEWSTGLSDAFNWKYTTDSIVGLPFVVGPTGIMGYLDPGAFDDSGSPIYCQVTTSKIDFDTIMRKRFFRLSLATDAPNGNVSEPMSISWSDDDYTTWIGPVTMELNASYPTITQLGYSRRRAFQFLYTQSFPLRMESFEVDITQEVRR